MVGFWQRWRHTVAPSCVTRLSQGRGIDGPFYRRPRSSDHSLRCDIISLVLNPTVIEEKLVPCSVKREERLGCAICCFTVHQLRHIRHRPIRMLYIYTGCVKIKRPNTKTAISQKCVNIFCTKLLFYVVFTRHTPKWRKLKLKERILQPNKRWFSLK